MTRRVPASSRLIEAPGSEPQPFVRKLSPAARARLVRAAKEQADEGLLHDPIEDDPRIGLIIEEARVAAEVELFGGAGKGGFGSCHLIWERQASILQERYGIEWMTPGDMNPFVLFD